MLDQKEKIKFGLAFIIVLSIAYAAIQYGQSVNDAYSTRTFTVEGKADITKSNDIATFTATVFTEGGLDQTQVQTQNTESMNEVVAYLEANGVAADDRKTENYSLTPKFNNPNCFGGRCEESKIIGYTATQNIAVKVRDAAKSGELVSGVVQNGATSVSQVSFTVDDNKDALQQARIEALRDAHKQAEELAKAGKFRLGKLVTFYEQGGPMEPYPMGGVMMDMAVAEKSMSPASPSPSLQPGSTEGEVLLTATYEIR